MQPSCARPFIIPVFIPHMGCPHQCIFCNQKTISGREARIPSAKQIHQEVNRFLGYGKRLPSDIQISFYGGNFLGLCKSILRSLLESVKPFVDRGMVDSIRFSTRPDTVDRQALDFLAEFPVSTVELGVQSMNDGVLKASRRGHSVSDTIRATALLKEKGYAVGLQLMVGLPQDNAEGAMETAVRIASLKPDFVRIYPTVVLNGSKLAERFNTGRYHPMQLAECVSLVKRIFLLFKTHCIPVARMGLQASDGLTPSGALLAGPYHPAFGHLVHSEIVFDAMAKTLDRMAHCPDPLVITAHPSMVSRVQGLEKQNIDKLKQAFNLKTIPLVQDAGLAKGRLIVGGRVVPIP